MSPTATSRDRPGQRSKTIEDVISYAVGHRLRVEILVLLNQGTYSTGELAEILGQPVNKIAHHMNELADGGAIEIAKSEKERNFDRHYYRAVLPPIYPKDKWATVHPVERQMIVGFLLQALIAEALGSLWAGKLSADPEVILAWDRLNVDEEGRKKITEAQGRHVEHLAELEQEALLRAARSGAETTPHMVAVLGFERALKAPEARTSANTD